MVGKRATREGLAWPAIHPDRVRRATDLHRQSVERIIDSVFWHGAASSFDLHGAVFEPPTYSRDEEQDWEALLNDLETLSDDSRRALVKALLEAMTERASKQGHLFDPDAVSRQNDG